MLDIKIIRQNPELVRAGMKKRNKDMDAIIDEIIAIDEKRRAISTKADEKKAEQNRVSKEIPKIKKEGGDVSAIMADMKKLSEEIKACDVE
ncbi:MAG: serine--tRNA ligase, partial [Oscillospiraceae bacterium]|nr:serine--tRNA ligase [Oscillospiraceae bacterium]